ncbi:hypothetical protein EDC94DRAFT_651678 [Helicostylum pulchrum]|nr:hypothetical protein EDC94DRAFT_651678 [Helicostylum pulchrum]
MIKLAQLVAILGTSLLAANSQQLLALYELAQLVTILGTSLLAANSQQLLALYELAQLVAILGTSLLAANSQQLLALYEKKRSTSDATMKLISKQRFLQLESPVRAGSAIFGLPTEL